MDTLTKSATLADPPELTEALAEFEARDRLFTEAVQRLDRYRRENVDARPTIVGSRFNTRVGAGSPALAQLEAETARRLDERNKALSRWAELKMAKERKAHGG